MQGQLLIYNLFLLNLRVTCNNLNQKYYDY